MKHQVKHIHFVGVVDRSAMRCSGRGAGHCVFAADADADAGSVGAQRHEA